MPNEHPAPDHDAGPPPPPPPPEACLLPLPQAHTLLASFATFLTVCIHNILYYRSIYPQTTFLSAKAYNLPVHQNRHPKVCSWIRDALDAVTAQLAGGNVDRIAVVIHSPLQDRRGSAVARRTASSVSAAPAAPPPGAVLERWVFDVARFPAWPGGADAMRDFGSSSAAAAAGSGRLQQPGVDGEEEDQEENAPGPADGTGAATGDVNWTDVDQQLRGAVRRLSFAAESMSPLPEGCTFTVAVEMKEEGQAPIGHPQAWIPSEPNLQPASTVRQENGRDIGGAKTTSVRSVEAGPLFFECWVEEGKAKDALRDTPSQEQTQASAS